MFHRVDFRALAVIAPACAVLLCARPSIAQHHRAREAHVTAVTGNVEAFTPRRHPLSAGDTLLEGQHLRVPEAASATLVMQGGGTMLVRNHADVFLYGDPSVRIEPPQVPTHETVTHRGSFVLTSEGTARSVALATPSCVLTLLRGEMQIRTTPAHTRFVVLRGRARLRQGTREVMVREGFGAKFDLGQWTNPRPIVAAPSFRAPTIVAHTIGHPVDVQTGWTVARGTPAATYRLQMARVQDFATVMEERAIPAATPQHTFQLPPGRYFVRVMGIDADEIEGRWSPTQIIDVTGPRVLPGGQGRVARLSIPNGMRCGVDTTPPDLQPDPIELLPGRHHTLRCLRQDNGAVEEVRISAQESGPLLHTVTTTPDVASDQHTLTIRLTDARGNGVPYASIRIEPPQGVTVDRVVEGDPRGTYSATIRWPARIGRARVRFIVDDDGVFEEELAP